VYWVANLKLRLCSCFRHPRLGKKGPTNQRLHIPTLPKSSSGISLDNLTALKDEAREVDCLYVTRYLYYGNVPRWEEDDGVNWL
jgi:hypothetical protein